MTAFIPCGDRYSEPVARLGASRVDRGGYVPRAPFRRFLAFLTGRPLVGLVDFDGEVNVRLVRRSYFGEPMATRCGLGVRVVSLMPDGTIRPRCYVERWFPLIGHPFASKGDVA